MNTAINLQVLQPGILAGETNKVEKSGNAGLFGSVFASLQDKGITVEKTSSADIQLLGELKGLIDLLSTGSLQDMEDGGIFARKLVLGEASISDHPMAEGMIATGSLRSSIDKLLEDFGMSKDPLDEEDSIVDINSLIALLTQMSAMPVKELKQLDIKAVKEVLQFSKLVELSAPFMDMTAEDSALVKKLAGLLESVKGVLSAAASHKETGHSLTTQPVSNEAAKKIIQEAFTRIEGVINSNSVKKTDTSGQELQPVQPSFHIPAAKNDLPVLSLAKGSQPVNQEQFIKQFENILAKAGFTNANGMQKLFIRLNPEHLGSLRIEIIQKDQMVTARILASTSAAKDTLEHHIQNLKQAFASQNLQIEKLEISQAMSQFTGEKYFQREGQQKGQQDSGQFKQDSHRDETDSGFNETLEEALVNMKV
ncbi:flagellar hook-length control protein FliK [Peribacillus sp. SCS-37]|uniref:flagellar hook-length control protein FliK n=1 Tax=Paraperibacillus esterisolvens TaxID=3115296 RepID=UPI0039063391